MCWRKPELWRCETPKCSVPNSSSSDYSFIVILFCALEETFNLNNEACLKRIHEYLREIWANYCIQDPMELPLIDTTKTACKSYLYLKVACLISQHQKLLKSVKIWARYGSPEILHVSCEFFVYARRVNIFENGSNAGTGECAWLQAEVFRPNGSRQDWGRDLDLFSYSVHMAVGAPCCGRCGQWSGCT